MTRRVFVGLAERDAPGTAFVQLGDQSPEGIGVGRGRPAIRAVEVGLQHHPLSGDAAQVQHPERGSHALRSISAAHQHHFRRRGSRSQDFGQVHGGQGRETEACRFEEGAPVQGKAAAPHENLRVAGPTARKRGRS
jgi:hypothetical protein